VGELNRNKNHQVIIRAISTLAEFKPYYLICGNGPEKESLEMLCEKEKVGKQVLFLGFRSDVAEILKCADCFAFPSRREGLGMAALEAMASGLPILTSDANGISEYSENGKTGFVCKPNDADGFAHAILCLMQDSGLRNKMGNYNRKAVEKFSIDHVNQIMTEIYKDQL
jgi:glycosyltransferase involved in cell wall biosynthesis